jgi:glycosyltransferase involved in cell wall biosynthesis
MERAATRWWPFSILLTATSARDSSLADISVVIASIESERRIRECLHSILVSAQEKKAEVIVIDASRDATAQIIRSEFPGIKLVTMPPGTLAPDLWSRGVTESKARAIAFTTGHFVVPPSWISDLSAALDTGVAGAGGEFSLDEGASLLDRAIYYLRYSAFLPGAHDAAPIVAEIAADNSMYRREAFDLHPAVLADGLWEVELHHHLRASGSRLTMVPRATIAFGKSFPLSVISRHRFAHGRHFGRWRVTMGARTWRILLLSPLVPFALLARASRRVRRAEGDTLRLAACFPIFLWLAACWAAGEAAGALSPNR